MQTETTAPEALTIDLTLKDDSDEAIEAIWADPFKGMMCKMDSSGDLKSVWDSRNEPEVDAARAQFDALRAKGYAAFSVNKDGSQGEIIREFDPKAEKIILVPPQAGG